MGNQYLVYNIGIWRRVVSEHVLALGVFAGALVSSFIWFSKRNRPLPPKLPAGPSDQSERNKKRNLGEWNPVEFDYPPITPCLRELHEIRPIPYRPFRRGEYHVTMGIRTMLWDEWIELDDRFYQYHTIRQRRIQARGQSVVRVLPDNPDHVSSGREAAVELVHELAEYLHRRYPSTFYVERHDDASPFSSSYNYGWNGAPPIKTITIKPLGESYHLPINANDTRTGEEALKIAASIVQDDLALMIEGSDGRYYFQAGAICVPGFWRMEDKIGMPLDEIHISGHVPRYEEKLKMSMERYFQKLSVDKPVTRNNYFFQVVMPKDNDPSTGTSRVEDIDPEELAWSESTNGPEDTFVHAHPAHLPTRSSPTPANLRLRSERQTLRRLPRSGAIVFTIRTYLTPVEELGKEPGIPGRLASALRGWGKDIGVYKGKERDNWWQILVDYMDQCHDEQMAQGISDTEYSYPF